jgi:hypothetical protein
MRQLYIFHERSHFEGTVTNVLLILFAIQNELTLVTPITG